MSDQLFETTEPKPIVYSCSGCSDAGELADRVARELNQRGVCEMSCLAGVGGRVKPLLMKAQRAERIVVIDGCPLNCARHTLLNAGITNFQHIALQNLGHRKGNCPVTPERVDSAVAVATNQITSQEKLLTA
ncbi:MAG: putative zinc-binding protein [Limisphaerales bacterium]